MKQDEIIWVYRKHTGSAKFIYNFIMEETVAKP
jgi:hypothetical protein